MPAALELPPANIPARTPSPETVLMAISPPDGRYWKESAELSPILSEWGLMRARVFVETEYLKALSADDLIPSLSTEESNFLDSLVTDFDIQSGERVKAIDKQVHHDVLATVNYMKEKLTSSPFSRLGEFVHLCPTSEDVDNLAYRILLQSAKETVVIPRQENLVKTIYSLASSSKDAAMLGETHGRPAGVTTFGRELLVFLNRLLKQHEQLKNHRFDGKFNGIIGTYSGFQAAYRKEVPLERWIDFSKRFITSFGFEPLDLTTQGNPNDDLVEFLQNIQRFNTISRGLAQDLWAYIDADLLTQQALGAGSSTSAGKINPWRLEHAEAMVEMGNGEIDVYTRNLPVYRKQRDLSDKTLMRFLGETLAISTNAWINITTQLGMISPDRERMRQMIEQDYSWLSEAIQLILRKGGIEAGYETVRKGMQGRTFTRDEFKIFVDQLIAELFKVPYVEGYLLPKIAALSSEQQSVIDQLQALSPQQFIDDAIALTQMGLESLSS